MSKFKKLAVNLFHEDANSSIDEALVNIAQEVLDLHNRKGEGQFNSTLMPPEEVLPNETESYQKIKSLVSKALKQNVARVMEVL